MTPSTLSHSSPELDALYDRISRLEDAQAELVEAKNEIQRYEARHLILDMNHRELLNESRAKLNQLRGQLLAELNLLRREYRELGSRAFLNQESRA